MQCRHMGSMPLAFPIGVRFRLQQIKCSSLLCSNHQNSPPPAPGCTIAPGAFRLYAIAAMPLLALMQARVRSVHRSLPGLRVRRAGLDGIPGTRTSCTSRHQARAIRQACRYSWLQALLLLSVNLLSQVSSSFLSYSSHNYFHNLMLIQAINPVS